MQHLKISDLSVGDWVMVEWPDGERWRGRLTRLFVTDAVEVCCANNKHVRCSSGFISSIPITAEILEANGFERSTSQFIVYHTDKVWISYDKPSETWSVTMYINDVTSNLHANILYIHQLQHALKLAGIDKEINL